MNQYLVNVVDVNDVPWQLPFEGESVEQVLSQFENNPEYRYLALVNIEQYVGTDYQWLVVWDGVADFGEGDPDEYGDGMTDVEADADTLRNAGMGTDEDYHQYIWGEDF